MRRTLSLLLIAVMLVSIFPTALAENTEERIIKYVGKDGVESISFIPQEDAAEQEDVAPMILNASAGMAKATIQRYPDSIIPTYTSVTGRALKNVDSFSDRTEYVYKYYDNEYNEYLDFLVDSDGWEFFDEHGGSSEGYITKSYLKDNEIANVIHIFHDGTHYVHVLVLKNGGFVEDDDSPSYEDDDICFDVTSRTMIEGNIFWLTYCFDSEISKEEISWSSSNTKVAAVDSKGCITAKNAGSATITAELPNGNKATCSITVKKFVLDHYDGTEIPTFTCVTGITPFHSEKEEEKSYYYYDYDVYSHDDYGRYLEFKDGWRYIEEIVDEDSGLIITYYKKGKTEVVVTKDYTNGYTCVAFDTPARLIPVKTLKLSTTKATVYVGSELDLSSTLTVSPFENTDEITWTSSKPSVATVDENGIVTPIATGTAKITATAVAGKKTATCTVTVARMPEGIIVTGETAVAQGKTTKLTAYAYYTENGKTVKTKDAISWRSDDTEIATVSKGTVKGISAGKADVIAYLEGTDIEEVIEITVAVPVKSLKFASTKATVYVGSELDLGAKLTVSPFENTDNITWKSSNEKVATVDENGIVTPIATGTAKITATAVAGKKTATCTVTVARMPEGIIVTGDTAVAQGKTTKLTAYAYYTENGKTVKTKDAISWRSDDTEIATVSKGTVKGISAGATDVIAYLEGTDIEEVIEVSVVVPVKTLKFASTKATVYVGSELDLDAKLTVSPFENTDNITWKSSNTKVATVDENGVVTPIKTGTAKITATAVAGKKSATCTITVK